MSFNRRGNDRDRFERDRFDRGRRGGPGDRPPRDRPEGDRGYAPRERSFGPPRGGGERSGPPRPRFDRGTDEGGMSLRLDPRRLSTLKRLAGDVGMRPGDLVRTWVEERIDAERGGAPAGERAGAPAPDGVLARLDELAARVAALETAAAAGGDRSAPTPETQQAPNAESAAPAEESADTEVERSRRTSRNAVSAAPSANRVALHDEMIEVLRERGPMTAADLAGAIAERGRYAPPRSGKALDAAMVSQRVSNPTYRGRFTRNEGRIGLADETG